MMPLSGSAEMKIAEVGRRKEANPSHDPPVDLNDLPDELLASNPINLNDLPDEILANNWEIPSNDRTVALHDLPDEFLANNPVNPSNDWQEDSNDLPDELNLMNPSNGSPEEARDELNPVNPSTDWQEETQNDLPDEHNPVNPSYDWREEMWPRDDLSNDPTDELNPVNPNNDWHEEALVDLPENPNTYRHQEALLDLPYVPLVDLPRFPLQDDSSNNLINQYASLNANIPSPFAYADRPTAYGMVNSPNTFSHQGGYRPTSRPQQLPVLNSQQSFQYRPQLPPPQQPSRPSQQSFPQLPPLPPQQSVSTSQQSFPQLPPPPPQQSFSTSQQSFPFQPPPYGPFSTTQQSFRPPQQPFRPSQQSFKPSQQPYSASQQSYPQQQGPFRPSQQSYPQQQQQQQAPHQSYPQQQQQQGPHQSFPQPQWSPQPGLHPPYFTSRIVTNSCHGYLPLSQAVARGDLDAVRWFLYQHPEAATAKLLEDGLTALHLACHHGHVDIVKELLTKMSPADVIVKREFQYHTPLTATAVQGNLEIARALITKNLWLLEMPGNYANIPVVAAITSNQKRLARYLYSQTPVDLLLHNNAYHGTLLLTSAISFKVLDIPLHLLQLYPRLAVTNNFVKGSGPLPMLASMPSLFRTSSKLGLWQSLIYPYVHVEEPSALLDSFYEPTPQGLLRRFFNFSKLFGLLRRFFNFSKLFGIHEVRELKKTHLRAEKLMSIISREVSMMGHSDRTMNRTFDGMWAAVQCGNVEFIVEMIRTNPELLFVGQDDTGKTLFLMAIEYRQEKIFNLLYSLHRYKAHIISDTDINRNGVLHYAGYHAPQGRLDDIPGPAMQLQRELQWFKIVESILSDVQAEKLNSQYLKPRHLFTVAHANLQKDAAKWMKDTTTACSLVAALIVTVTFAACFSVPGGTDQILGSPLRRKDSMFMVFIISDIISFFSSSTSVLIFLGILTARYSENDFLITLPTKMIAGLSLLFLSIAAMLLAFSAALSTLLYRWSWIAIPVFLLVFFPVILFVLLQSPLLYKMIRSTYRNGIFDLNMKSCL